SSPCVTKRWSNWPSVGPLSPSGLTRWRRNRRTPARRRPAMPCLLATPRLLFLNTFQRRRGRLSHTFVLVLQHRGQRPRRLLSVRPKSAQEPSRLASCPGVGGCQRVRLDGDDLLDFHGAGAVQDPGGHAADPRILVLQKTFHVRKRVLRQV